MAVIERRRRYPGRERVDDRAALNGILFVLHTGVAMRDLPQEFGYGSGVTRWRRLREWQQAGVWERLHQTILKRLNGAGQIDWSRAAADSSHIRALLGGLHTGPSPVDRARTGAKHHLLTDAGGLPLAITLTGGNRKDITQLLALIDGVAPVAGKVGRPRKRPAVVLADRGYDHDKDRREIRARAIKPIIARRQTEHGTGLGRHRSVVERTFTWPHQFRRLRIRWQRDPEIHLAFMNLARAIVCWRRPTHCETGSYSNAPAPPPDVSIDVKCGAWCGRWGRRRS